MKIMRDLFVIVVGSILGILGAWLLGWWLLMVIFPLGLAVTILFLGLLGTLMGMISLFKAQR